MSSSRSNVGGVFSVVIWEAKESGRSDPPTSLDSEISTVRVPIISAQSGYTEVVTINGDVTLVEHTLTLTTESRERFWSEKCLAEAQRVGCIAEVELSSHGKILLGWSPHLGYDQPLRLTKTSLKSSDSVNQSCLKTWVFKSYSTKSLM